MLGRACAMSFWINPILFTAQWKEITIFLNKAKDTTVTVYAYCVGIGNVLI